MKVIISAIALGVLIFNFPHAGYSQACAPVPAGLVSFWPGEGTPNDLQGANHGTLQNGAGFTDLGRVGPAFALDGVDDRVLLPSMNIGSTYTVELWMYPTSPGSYQHLFSNSWNAPGEYGALYLDGNVVSYWQGSAGRTQASVLIPQNQWTHVALTFNGTVNQIYINGLPSGLPSTNHTEVFNNNAVIGYSDPPESSHFQGRLDDVSLYNTVLTPNQISFIYNAGRSGKCIAPALTVEDTSVLEVNSGTSSLNFSVSSIRSSSSSIADYATADGTATAPADYTPVTGSLSVPASGTTTTLSVPVNGDTMMEQNETLFLNLSNPVGAALANPQATGTIFSDDCALAPSGLNNWWRADGNAEDSVGPADAMPQNGASFITGIRGEAFAFDGVDDSVLTPAINLGSAYTVEFWMYPTSNSINQETVSYDYQTSNYGSLYFNSNYMEYWYNGDRSTSSIGAIPLNQWTHVALTYDGAASRLYINGAQSGTPGVHAGETFNNPLRFGNAVVSGPATSRFRGLLDEITLFNRALSATEIQGIYSAYGGGICLAPTAAGVDVSGRVLTPDGRGVRGARVSITDRNGETRAVLTTSFGYYRFEDVLAGQSYVVSVSAKGHSFAPRLVSVIDTLTNFDFVADVSK
jgi:hypothetical protein